ncbi:hypothetical protein C8F04DRAFT_1240142 [Mycena alexandri]|uniref:Uncharacterized protein n=1 Tax=Mycena alexandri TaxID=1745969 RepID=A0AAD6SB98_9AGAR|nr:hypothetical protein C8F04DRAFT_1240142 [Mycena alexandri]
MEMPAPKRKKNEPDAPGLTTPTKYRLAKSGTMEKARVSAEARRLAEPVSLRSRTRCMLKIKTFAETAHHPAYPSSPVPARTTARMTSTPEEDVEMEKSGSDDSDVFVPNQGDSGGQGNDDQEKEYEEDEDKTPGVASKAKTGGKKAKVIKKGSQLPKQAFSSAGGCKEEAESMIQFGGPAVDDNENENLGVRYQQERRWVCRKNPSSNLPPSHPNPSSRKSNVPRNGPSRIYIHFEPQKSATYSEECIYSNIRHSAIGSLRTLQPGRPTYSL